MHPLPDNDSDHAECIEHLRIYTDLANYIDLY